MANLTNLVESLTLVLTGWILVQLWSNAVNVVCFVTWKLNPNYWLHVIVVAAVVTIIFIAGIRLLSVDPDRVETEIEAAPSPNFI